MYYDNLTTANESLEQQQQAINKKQLAEQMGISMSTLKRQLKSANLDIKRGLISPVKQVEIYQTLGWAETDPTDLK